MNNATFTDISTLPGSLREGEATDVALVVRNLGTTTWTDAANYRLGECDAVGALLHGPTPWSAGRLFLDPMAVVAPGNLGTFKGTIVAPHDNKLTECLWRMLEEGREAFGPVGGLGPAPNNGILIRRLSEMAIPAPSLRGGGGAQVANTGAYPMGPCVSGYNELRCWEWTAPRPLACTGGMIWTGVSHIESQADIVAMLYSQSGHLLSCFAWDFYAKATGPHQPFQILPDIVVERGESIRLYCFARPVAKPPADNWYAHHAAHIWWREIGPAPLPVQVEPVDVAMPEVWRELIRWGSYDTTCTGPESRTAHGHTLRACAAGRELA